MLFRTILFVIVELCSCNHFRGGSISWRPTGKTNQVEFTYKLGWTYGGGAGCTNALSGQYVNGTNFDWTCTTGCAASTTISRAGYVCSSASQLHDWEQGEYTFTYTFSHAGQFTVEYASCCWITLDYGAGTSGDWTIATDVDLRQRSDINRSNSSPVYTGYPIYTIKYGCTSTVKLQVSDADNDNIRCRWANGSEYNSVCKAIPNSVLNQNACTLTFTASHKPGGIYAGALIIEDMPKSSITLNGATYTTNDVLSSVPVQFLVETPNIPSRQCSDRPIFVVPTPSGTRDIDIHQGHQLTVEVYVLSVGANVTSFALVGPPGIQKSAISSVAGRADVYVFTVTWTPSMAQIGHHTLCADVTDAFGVNSDPHCVQINVFDTDPCSSYPCRNSGTCSRIGTSDSFVCSCSGGFTGSFCETDIDECQSTPCMNSATCHDQVNGFVCECLPGYTGTVCETDIDECQSGPCTNNGTCFNLINSFFCGCQQGYSGERCEIDIDDCLHSPCLNDGNCTDLVDSFMCTCPVTFTGEICQTGMNPCNATPCKNNGRCKSYNSTYFKCFCVDGWEGITCAYRHQNESFVTSSFMTDPHMHYSDCNCFLGNLEQHLCLNYKTGQTIGYGALGMFLGVVTVVALYILSELILCKTLQTDKTKYAEETLKTIDAHNVKDDFVESEVVVEEKNTKTKQPEPKKVRHHGHRHKNCWACDIKYNGVPPPRYWGMLTESKRC